MLNRELVLGCAKFFSRLCDGSRVRLHEAAAKGARGDEEAQIRRLSSRRQKVKHRRIPQRLDIGDRKERHPRERTAAFH